MKFFEACANIFRVPDLRKRLLFTLAMLAVYRLGGHVPTPGIHLQRWEDFFRQSQGSIFGFFDLFAGGNIRRLTIFALGIMPYITASIILQLLSVVIPSLEKMQKEGPLGQKKITQWTRYLTLGLSIVQSFGIAQGLEAMGGGIVVNPGIGFVLLTIMSMTTGSIFIMWLGEQITDRGIGNGMSLIIFAGIVVGLGPAIGNIYTNVFVTREWSPLTLIVIVVMMVLVVAFVVFMERGELRLPVQYAQRVVGRRVMGGQSTYMPMKVNMGGVIPPIFAVSLLAFPQTIRTLPLVKHSLWMSSTLAALGYGEPLYYISFIVLNIFFCFFYVSIIFNPSEAADNMRKYGGFVPGIRPGRNTADYMNVILTKLTMVGALYLCAICLLPDIMISGIKLQHLPLVGNWMDTYMPRFLLDGLNVHFFFGGTSLLIVVGVAMDTIAQIESHLVMRHYEGFTTRSRQLRGRRSSFSI
ncbi:MAG TPA: preprotein translocase subunit SecY [Bryobacteraceae bacterium]|nr:preprotein translocase subunit SecY [Bryobacteraceae bacterium]